MSLLTLESSELAELAAQVRKDYEDLKAKGLKLDLTRGKPAKAQLDLSNDLLALPGPATTPMRPETTCVTTATKRASRNCATSGAS